jgi:hypothetical protein
MMLSKQVTEIREMRMLVLRAAAIAVMIVGALAPKIRGDTFDERVRDAPQCQVAYQQLSAEAHAVLDSVAKLYAQQGRMPSYPEYLELLADSKQHLTASDRMNLYWVFGSVQKPLRSQFELHDLLRAQRASLTSFSTRYRVDYLVKAEAQNGPKPPAGDYRKECKFLFAGKKVLFECSDYRGAALQKKQVEAYDGDVLRGKLDSPDGSAFGSVATLESRNRFFTEGNPLLCAKLMDGAVDLQADEQANWDDLAEFATHQFVYETPVKIGRFDCVVIGNDSVQVFCSPQHGFAVAEQRMGGLEVDPKTGGYVRTKSSIVLKNSGFTEVYGKVWLPRRSECRWPKHDQLVQHYVVTVDAFEANPVLADATFSDIIPKGTPVADVIKNKTYVQGADDDTK